MTNNADLVIKNARLLLETGIHRGGMAVKDGAIVSISSDTHLPPGDEIIDLDGKMVMPGLIDAHAHIHDPTMLKHEDFTTGTQAAAAGGVTTVVDMPLTNQMDTVDKVRQHIKDGESNTIIDFSLYAGMMNSENWGIIPTLTQEGIVGFKAFTCEPYQTNNGVITRLLSETSEYGGHITVHAEDQGVISEFQKDMEGEWDAPVSHSLSRPNQAEQFAIAQMIKIAKETRGHLHIAHVTTAEGLGEIGNAKLRGVMLTTEVCPHHLMLDRDRMNQLGPNSKMNPPLRSKHDCAALWSGLLRGMIDIVVSDHAPCPIEEKEAGKNDIRDAWSGVDGIQTILRILLSEGIDKNRISWQRLLHITSRNPAKLFGLYPRKGALQIGSDADFVVIDPTREEKLSSDMMFSKCGWTLYEGMKMKGVPVSTYVRGKKVFENNQCIMKPGYGKFQSGLNTTNHLGTG